MEKFESLIAWQKAHQLVKEIYKTTKKFPQKETFILIPQIIRAAISIPANIVEGTKRRSIKDQSHFLNMAEASLEEVKYYIILAVDLSYIHREESKDLLSLSEEVGRLLSGLIRKRRNLDN